MKTDDNNNNLCLGVTTEKHLTVTLNIVLTQHPQKLTKPGCGIPGTSHSFIPRYNVWSLVLALRFKQDQTTPALTELTLCGEEDRQAERSRMCCQALTGVMQEMEEGRVSK